MGKAPTTECKELNKWSGMSVVIAWVLKKFYCVQGESACTSAVSRQIQWFYKYNDCVSASIGECSDFMNVQALWSYELGKYVNILILFTQPLRSGRIWLKVNFLSGV